MNCKSILGVFIPYRFFVWLGMVLTSVISCVPMSVIKSGISYHKKSLDLITGNFLLHDVVLLSDLSSATGLSGVFQARLLGQMVFCLDKRFTLFCLSMNSSLHFKGIEVHLCHCFQQAYRSVWQSVLIAIPYHCCLSACHAE